MKTIPLSKGKVAIVDDQDFEELSCHKWHFEAGRHRGYAGRWEPFIREGRRSPRRIYMHRVILNPPDGMVCDHINGNKLDNRRANLRVCTHAENMRNRSPYGVSQFLGVHWNKACNRWVASITSHGKRKHLCVSQIEEEAARMYDRAAIEMHGSFARLNFPNEAAR